MAEIALLVTEEFENGRRRAKEDGIEAINRMVYGHVSAMVEKVEKGFVVFLKHSSLEAKQPRSSVGLAAVDGFFSA